MSLDSSVDQLVTSQSQQSGPAGSVMIYFEALRVEQFMRLHPLTFISSEVEDDPLGFIDEIEKIF